MPNSIRYRNQQIPVTGTILESFEQLNIPLVSQCRSGLCGACRIKLKKGKVSYIQEPLGFFDDDEILSCCAVPQNNVEVDTP